MHGEHHGFRSSNPGGAVWLEWRSVAIGAVATLTIAYACVVRPARLQVAGLERQLTMLADVVSRLDVAGGDVSATGRLLAALQDQAGQIESADAALRRIAAVQERLAAQTERLARLGSTLTAQAVDIDDAQDQLDRLVGLKSELLHHSSDLVAAETTLVHLQELTDWLASSAAVVGDLRHFVVDVVLLQPSVERAREALEPVISLTRAGRSRGGSRSTAKPADQFSAKPDRQSSAQPTGGPSRADEPAAAAENRGDAAEETESPVLTSAVPAAAATSR